MSNKNVRGIHLKTYTKGFRLYFTHGHSRRAIDGVLADSNLIHTGAFQRDVMGIRISAGNLSKFETGFSIVTTKDIRSSIDKEYYKVW